MSKIHKVGDTDMKEVRAMPFGPEDDYFGDAVDDDGDKWEEVINGG